MKNIFLHIGMGKTGTTTLQYGLKYNYDLLLKFGWLYPKTGRNFQENSVHHNVAFDITNDPRFIPNEGGLTEIIKEIINSPAKNIILSSEVFNQDSIKILDQRLSGIGDVKIIVYLRRQVLMFPSLWAELVKTCEIKESFEEWFTQDGHRHGYYYEYLQKWAVVFGKENMIIKPLEQNQMNGHILEDFLKSCAFTYLDDLYIPKNKNRSLGIKTLGAMRFFTNKFGVAVPPLGNHFSYRISMIIEDYSRKMDWNAKKPNVMSAELAREIEQRYAENNKNCATEFLDQEELFLDNLSFNDFKQSVPNSDNFTSDEVFDLMAYVLDRFHKNSPGMP